MIAYVFKPRRRNTDGKLVPTRTYRGRYRLDGDLAVSDVALGTRDKQTAEKKLREIIQEKEREAAEQTLTRHLKDYIDELTVLGRTKKHISNSKFRIERLMQECRWMLPKDVHADNFVTWRSQQKDMAPKTQNEYLNAISAFLRWMEVNGRMAGHPLKHIRKVDVRGRQARRRAFTAEEFSRLIAVGSRHRPLYLAAAYTGLRQGELLQLIWHDLHLDEATPYLCARASTTKNRKEAILPLHPKLAEVLRQHRPGHAQPEDAVFNATAHPERPLFRDMEKASIPKVDPGGRKLDFHSLRYTFATNLAKNGATQRVTQELMRHSDPKLTAQVYTDASQLPTSQAVHDLPWLGDAPPPPSGVNVSQIASQKLVPEGQILSQPGTCQSEVNASQDAEIEVDSRELSRSDLTGQLVRVAGIEPASQAWEARILPMNYTRLIESFMQRAFVD